MFPYDWRIISCITPSRIKNTVKVGWSLLRSMMKMTPSNADYPLVISIEPTNYCNLRCLQCPTGVQGLSRPAGMISMELYRRIIDDISPYTFYLILYFQGEPFLHPEFSELVSYARSKKMYVVTSTNGHYLKNDVEVRKIVDSGLNVLIVSIDGLTQEVYQKYRIGGDLEVVNEGIKRLLDVRREKKSSLPRVYLQFIVMKHNEHQVPDLKSYARNIGVDKVLIKSAQIYDEEDKRDLLPIEKKYRRYWKQNGKLELARPHSLLCTRILTTSVISWDGRIVPCCFDKDADYEFGRLN